MPKATTESGALVFRGPPRRLRLETELPEFRDAHFEPDAELSAVLSRASPFHARTDGEGRLRGARARFDRSTPPGEYHARLVSADAELPVVVHVEAHPRLRISPAVLVFSAAEGSKPRATVILTNKGNVPLDIPAATTVSLCRDDGLDDALTSALLTDSDEFEELFRHFVERLRALHGGLLPLRFLSGSGLLAAGRSVAAVVEAEFSPRLAAGHGYHGGIVIHGSRLQVAVTVTA